MSWSRDMQNGVMRLPCVDILLTSAMRPTSNPLYTSDSRDLKHVLSESSLWYIMSKGLGN